MARKEPKLRPSLSWSEIQCALNALDYTIQGHVKSSSVTVDTIKMVELQTYLKSFEPAIPVGDNTLAMLMAKLKQQTNNGPVSAELLSDELTGSVQTVEESATNAQASLTPDQRFQMLKLRDESTYNEEEKEFYLKHGFMVKMREAKLLDVDSSDL